MIVSVHQPQYLPWIGYFHKMLKSDVFVFLDNVQYKSREYQNRNRIRTKDGWMWLTVPVLTSGDSFPNISRVLIDNSRPWRERHRRAIETNYSRAPYYKKYRGLIEDIHAASWERLVDLNMRVVRDFASALGVKTPVKLESELGIDGKNTGRIIEICRALGADTYLSGSGGKAYLDEPLLAGSGIKLLYQDFRHPEYPQRYAPFEPFMSACDLMFNCGQDSLDIILSGDML